MTRRPRHAKPSAWRRTLLPALGAIPAAVVVTCAGGAGNAAAQPSLPAPAPSGQFWTGPVRHVAPRIDPSAVQRPGRVHYGIPAPALVPGGDHAVRGDRFTAAQTREAITSTVRADAENLMSTLRAPTVHRRQGSPNATAARPLSPIGGPHPVDDNYSNRVTQSTVNGGTAGAIIGTAVAGIPAAVVGAIPGALVGGGAGAVIGGIAGAVVLGVPTLGMAVPVGIIGGTLAGAGIGAVLGAVVGAVATGVPIGITGGVVGYELGAATGLGNGQQG